MSDLDPVAIADRFGLGGEARIDGPPEHGELGAVWPLRTDRGRWAVKRGNDRQDAGRVEASTRVQDAAITNGVLAPAAIRTREGDLLADVDGVQVPRARMVRPRAAEPRTGRGRDGRPARSLACT